MSVTKMRKVVAPISLIAALGLTLSACGSDSDTSDEPGDEAPAGDETSEAPADDADNGGDEFSGVTLEVAGAWSGAEQENFEEVLAEFEDNTGAKVNYTSFGDKAATTLGTQIEGGSPPDVALLSQPALLNQLASDGHLSPLSDATKEDRKSVV